jgi:hypothetical protein
MTQALKLSPSQVVARWGGNCTTGTLANWRTKKKGPPYQKLGAKVFYPLELLEQWEAKNMHLVPDNDNNPKQ